MTDAQSLNRLGIEAAAAGDYVSAISLFRRAAALDPSDPKVAFNLGEASKRAGDIEEAIASFACAARLQPDMADAHYQLAVQLEATGALHEAEAAYRRATALDPDNARMLANLAALLFDTGRRSEPLALLQRAVALAPAIAEIHHNLGTVLEELGRFDEAVASFRRAVALKPEHAGAVADLAHASQLRCDWTLISDLHARALEGARSGQHVEPFALLSIADDPGLQYAAARRHAATLRIRGRSPLPRPARKPQSRLRIGYVSGDFREHATAYLAAALFEHHDRRRFEITGYSIGPPDDSPMRQRLVAGFDRFVDFHDTDDELAARRIHADSIDILVDLQGYSRGARTRILAFRPAPIQVSYLGYPGTMGADFIDYIIVDSFVVPLDQQPVFTERLVHLPNCYQPNDAKRPLPEVRPTRAKCGLPDHGIVFCSFNAPYKILPVVFDLWARLMKAVPASVLWLLSPNETISSNLRREIAARGIDPSRLLFASPLPLADHLSRLGAADLFLDTLPVNAHTTASDALWCGVPVVTCAGRSFVSRVAGSLLHAVGLPQLVTRSLEQYEATVLRLARDPDELAGLRAYLETSRSMLPLFDSARQTRELEAALEEMWRIHSSGKPPRAFAVAANKAPPGR